MVPADQFASADVTIAPMGEFSTDGYQVVQQANILQDVIDFFQEIIDILEGRTPGSTQQDPEPDDPITTDEEREDINDAVDEAEDEGVDVPEERVEANWSYKEVEGFLLLMIDLIEDYMQNGSE